jgi:Tol biopolymer transport system component/DNA-binding winged helix-turn-helix (wHTH) protein
MSDIFYDFGPFRVDASRRVLLREGKAVPLSPKVFDTLFELVRNAGKVVTKDELLTAVWPDTAVEENSLARSVSSLRKALGESTSDHQYIVTVPGRGYRFVADIREVTPVSNGTGPKPPRAMQHKLKWAAVAATVAAVILTRLAVTPRRPARFETTMATKITSSGTLIKAVLSPDGRYIAYVLSESGLMDLKLRDTESMHDTELVPPTECCYLGITFSPDSRRLYFVSRKAKSAPASLYSIPITGGQPRKLKDNVDSPVTLSPDEKRYAFVREMADESALIIAGMDSGSERKLLYRKLPQVLDYPAWSPDGRIIACTSYDSTLASAGSNVQILTIDAAGGEAKLLSGQRWGFAKHLSWLGDGSGLVMSAHSEESYLFHLWLVSYPSGAARKITEGLNSQVGASVTADSRQIVTVEENWFSSMWRLPSLEVREPVFVISDVTGRSTPLWMPDGKILFEQELNGARTLWTINPDGKDQKPLTQPPDTYHASFSADGKRLAFVSNRGGTPSVWTMDVDGGNPVKAVEVPGWYPSLSPDAGFIVYTARGAKYWTTLWRVSSKGGTPKELNDKLWEQPVISPDGKWIAAFYADQGLNTQTKPIGMAVIGIDGGQPWKTFPLAPSVSTYEGIRWTPDGRCLTYVASGKNGENIWSQPVEGGEARQITDFHGEALFGFDWSADGKQLIYSRGIQANDIVLIRDTRK